MFLRATIRKKDGKEHTYFSVVKNKRVHGKRVVQRQCCIWARSTPRRSGRGVSRLRCWTKYRRHRGLIPA